MKKEPGYDAWFKQKVEKGLQELKEGKGIPHEQVEAEFKARRERGSSK